MKIGLALAYWGLGFTKEDQAALAVTAEQLGFDSLWVAEGYGSDAVSVLAWLAAHTTRIRLGSSFFSPEHVDELRAPLIEGARSAGRDPTSVRVCPQVPFRIDDDIDRAHDAMRPIMSLYVGGMGALEKNFYAHRKRRRRLRRSASAACIRRPGSPVRRVRGDRLPDPYYYPDGRFVRSTRHRWGSFAGDSVAPANSRPRDGRGTGRVHAAT